MFGFLAAPYCDHCFFLCSSGFVTVPDPVVVVRTDGETTVYCHPSTGTAQWLKEGSQITGNNLQSECSCVASVAPPVVNLTFIDFNVDHLDGDTYSCQVPSEFGAISFEFTLALAGKFTIYIEGTSVTVIYTKLQM